MRYVTGCSWVETRGRGCQWDGDIENGNVTCGDVCKGYRSGDLGAINNDCYDI